MNGRAGFLGFWAARIKHERSTLFQLHRKCVRNRPGGTLSVAVAVLCLMTSMPVVVQAQNRTQGLSRAPEGTYLQVGAAALGGQGLNVGGVIAGRMFTREVHFVSDLEPLLRRTEDQSRVALLVGVAVRVYGVERTIGSVPYRGFDVDIALRAGPAVSFSTRDDIVARNNRFALLLEPAIRVSHARPWKSATRPGRIWFVELGTVGPSLRAGLWIPLF